MKWILIAAGLLGFLVIGISMMVVVSQKNAAARNLHGNARFANNRELRSYEYRGPYNS